MAPTLDSFIIGPLGTVSDLYGVIEARLNEKQTGWDDLARSLGVSRQYLTRVLRQSKIPLQLATDACKAVGLHVEDRIKPTKFVRMICDDDAGGSGGGGSGGGESAKVEHLRELLEASEDECIATRRQLEKERSEAASEASRQIRERSRELEEQLEEQASVAEVALRERTRRCIELEGQLAEARAQLQTLALHRPAESPQSQHFSF